MRLLCVLATALLLPGVFGCGDGLKRVHVQGKLTAKNGPVDGATVQFIPQAGTKGEGGIGRTDKDGNFTLTGSRAGAKGVVPGEYKIRVSRLIARDGSPLPADATEADNPGSRESIPPPYNNLDATTLKVTVPESGGPLTVEIPAPVAGRR